jgi:hypothetical protein
VPSRANTSVKRACCEPADPAALLAAWHEAAEVIDANWDDMVVPTADALRRTGRISGNDLRMIWNAGL